MLDVVTVVPYLLERGLIESEWIIEGTLTIRDVSRRNRNLRVEGPDGRGVLVKQPHAHEERGGTTLARERLFHEYCRDVPAAAALGGFLPRIVHADVENSILVFELIAHGRSLSMSSTGQGSPPDDLRAARRLGQALARLHRAFRPIDPRGDPRLARLHRGLPSALGVHRPVPGDRAALSPAEMELVRLLQTQGGFVEHLERTIGLWRPEAVIHGDIRCDNVLVSPHRGDHDVDDAELWIVDWETVGIGDPAWDLAGALQDFLVLWVCSLPLSDDATIEEMIAGAPVPLEQVREASRALWGGYRSAAGLEAGELRALLRRAMAYVAIRLIQSARELLGRSEGLAGHPVLLLQVSANVFAEPELGQVRLFGIPPGRFAS
jgi:Ser/Thr protein kinase RdoA (MazF antagonist)